MSAPKIGHWLGAAIVTVGVTVLGIPPSASAASCPDIDVTFARATGEPPGIGEVGREFVDALRAETRGRSIAVYAVNYPASDDFAPSANAGSGDARAHVEAVAVECPNTKQVLGGYSQGAVVIDLITIAQFPVAGFVPNTVPEDVANRIAALALFGNPADRYLRESVSTASPWYGAKTIDLCAPGDAVCATDAGLSVPTHEEINSAAHLSYPHSAMPAQAAAFAASRV